MSLNVVPSSMFILFSSGIVSGVIISAVGTCKTGIVGSLLMAVGMVSSAFVTTPYLLYATYGITAGGYRWGF